MQELRQVGAEHDWGSLVFVASEKGFGDLVLWLHKHGADINEAQNADGWTPAHAASGYGNAEVLRVLGKLGADLNLQDFDGRTPAHIASENGHAEVMRVLGELCADINIMDRNGSTPAFLAWENGHVQVMHVLNELGSDSNAAIEAVRNASQGRYCDAAMGVPLSFKKLIHVFVINFKQNIAYK